MELERRGEDLAERLPIVVFTAAPDGSITYLNRRWNDLAGMLPEDSLGWRWLEAIDLADSQRIAQAWHASLLNATPFRLAFRVRNAKTRRARWVVGEAEPVWDASGDIANWYGVLSDVDAQLRSEAQYRRIADTALEGIWILDAAGLTTFMNPQLATLLGIGEHAIVGSTLEAFVGAQTARDVRSTIAAGTPYRGEHRFRTGDGPSVWAHLTAHALRDEDGIAAGTILTVAEIAARDPSDLAAATEEQSRAILEALPQLVWTASPSGTTDYFSAKWYAFTGMLESESAGDRWLNYVHAADRARVARAWAQAVTSGSLYSSEHRLFRAEDGTYRWFLSRGVPLRSADGRIVRWFGISTEIDDQKRASETLRFLAEAGEIFIGSVKVEPMLQAFAELVVPAIGDYCTILFCENGRFHRVASAARSAETAELIDALFGNSPFRLSESAPGMRAYATGRTVYLCDLDLETREAFVTDETGVEIVRKLATNCVVAVPLGDAEAPFGFIHIGSGSGRDLSASDVDLVEDLARRAALAVVNARLFERERLSAKRLQYLAEAGRILSQSLELDRMLDGLARLFLPELADWSIINLVEDDGRIRSAASAHADPAIDAKLAPLRNAYILDPNAAVGTPRVLRTGRAEIDAASLQTIVADFEWPAELGFGSSVVVPIVARGRRIGTFTAAFSERSGAFSEASLPFFAEIAQRAASAIENARAYERERRVADTLQQASLPASLPEVVGLRFSGVYVPGQREAQIGGDWYDALRLADGRIVLSIGDVAGSGLPAAVIMSSMRHVIRGIAQVHADPNLMLAAADKALRTEHPDRLVTAFVGVFDPVTLTLAYASAGHPAPFLRQPDGTVTQLEHGGLPLGLLGTQRDESPSAVTRRIEPESLLVLYTDGLVESTRDIEEGERRVRAALDDDALSASRDVAKALHDRVLFDGSHDDVAILTVEVTPVVVGSHTAGSERPVRRWVFQIGDGDAAHEARREFVDYLRTRGDADADYYAAELVFGELVGNVLRYAPGPIEVTIDWTGPSPVLHVLDDGPGFQHVPALPSDVLSERGRGLYIVSALTEDFHVMRRPSHGSHARAVLAIRPARNGGSRSSELSSA